MGCNIIEQVSVRKLLDGRFFFIPSYQRGYRWTKKQIYDLCNDLLEYILKQNKSSFYSLQPLIVRKGKYKIDDKDVDAYEVIDGQQRLTTIFILYRFLVKGLNYNSMDDAKKDNGGLELYHIFYQTRPEDYAPLENSGFRPFKREEIKDIDIAHVSNAYIYLNNWLYNTPEKDRDCASATFALFSKDEFSPKRVKDLLFNFLNNNGMGSPQFIWYELDGEKDAIKEFLSENKGKIPLTDTEKIKALFLQRRNFENKIKDLKQLSIAKDWELIENTLHRNDFWSFVSNDIQQEDGRINIIFKYLFDKDPQNTIRPDEDDYLFRYYYQKFALIRKNETINQVSTGIDRLWNDVMDCFRMLQNWFYNPKVYNLVGLLIKHGCSIRDISNLYDQPSVVKHDDFIRELNRKIRKEIVDKIPIGKEQADLGIGKDEEYINLFFNNSADKAKMYDLFRFLNVRETNKTIDNALADISKNDSEKRKTDLKRNVRDVLSHIYRFPYEALDAFGWDIEHVDSATTNNLTDQKEQEAWLKEAEIALNTLLTNDENYQELKKELLDSANTDTSSTLVNMIHRVRTLIGEDESDVRKNWIGNLTLLDSGTNRSYQNKIFAWKADIIKKRVHDGIFVPICTQNIFSKSYYGCSNDRWKWSIDDKKAYHAYMLKEIQAFKAEFPDTSVFNMEIR
jgi:uncharacterized damage-inducible protein DinB